MDAIGQFGIALAAIIVSVLALTFAFLHLFERSRFLLRLRRKKRSREEDARRPLNAGLAYQLGQDPHKKGSEAGPQV